VSAKGKNSSAAKHLLDATAGRRFAPILADPPWRFQNKTGKVAPEHRRLSRYATLTLDKICVLPMAKIAAPTAPVVSERTVARWTPRHGRMGLYLQSQIIWHKVRKDGGSDGRGVGFYFRNVTEVILFGTRGKGARTLAPGRSR
jgi:N6-adenosine-specific RNA methylase IME4